MKGLLARFATALLGASLILLVVQGAPTSVTASGRAPSASVVAQARANFIKDMSSHAVNVGKDWVSPGAKHGVAPGGKRDGAAKTANGTVTLTSSANWGGYADAETGSSTVSKVSGTWIMPAVRCLPRPYQNSDAFLADWVGIDGFNDGTVEQLGSATQCFEGVEYYYVWYEMYPQGTVEEGTTACINDNVNCPRPGDLISASVTVTSAGSGENNYVLALTDHSRPQESFSTTQQCAADTCADSSAEWIHSRRTRVRWPVDVDPGIRRRQRQRHHDAGRHCQLRPGLCGPAIAARVAVADNRSDRLPGGNTVPGWRLRDNLGRQLLTQQI
jgi:hypothetical protein